MHIELTNAARCPVVYRSRPHATRNHHINTRDPDEISRLSRELGITWLQLFRIIDRVGTNVRAIRSAVLTDMGATWH
ncbi:MAG TPA: hypothetical protein VFB32_07285 [Rudaea sp.]|nr:hypothetical protein [Rudaea sp.]